jgi:hypothetical protein
MAGPQPPCFLEPELEVLRTAQHSSIGRILLQRSVYQGEVRHQLNQVIHNWLSFFLIDDAETAAGLLLSTWCFQIIFHIEHPKEDLALIANKFLKDYPISKKQIGHKKKRRPLVPKLKSQYFKCDE